MATDGSQQIGIVDEIRSNVCSLRLEENKPLCTENNDQQINREHAPTNRSTAKWTQIFFEA